MYHVQTKYPCNRRENELKSLLKNLKNHKCSFNPTPSLYKISRSNYTPMDFFINLSNDYTTSWVLNILTQL
jgi:hypothetical protein